MVVLDLVEGVLGAGAAEFGDEGAHTLGNINSVRPIYMPNLVKLGIGNIEGSRLPYNPNFHGAFGKLMADIISFINTHPGPYYIHCRLGTDRTGVTSAVLAALCGAS